MILPEALKTGMQMELVLRELYQDDEHVYFTWNWKPINDEAGDA